MDSETRFNRYDDFNSRMHVISGRILMVAITVLMAVILFILVLHIYARCIWQRSLGATRRRRGASRRRRLAFAGDQEQVRLHRVGLEKSVIEALPVFVYRAENRNDEGVECSVCLCEFEENEKARLLPRCNHSFHIECIDMWFHSNSTCPLCRTSVQPDRPPLEVEAGPVGVVMVGETQGAAGEERVSAVSITVDSNREGVSEDRISLRSHSNSNLVDGTPSRKAMERIVQADMPPGRSDSFPSTGTQLSLKSSATRLHSLRRILSRSVPQSPDGSVHMELGGPVKV